jgi:hypothetical protein
MTAGGAAILAIALAYSLIYTRRRRDNPFAQRLTTAATRELNRDEEFTLGAPFNLAALGAPHAMPQQR